MAVWNSVFLHEFLDGNPANLRALPGDLIVLPNGPVVEPTPDPADRGFRVSPGHVLGYQFQGALANIIGVDLSVDLVMSAQAAFEYLTVVSLGGGAVTLMILNVEFVPVGPNNEGRANFRFTVAGETMDFTLRFVPSQTIRLRVRWHTHGQVQVWQERLLRAYQPGFAAGHTVGIDRLAVGGPGGLGGGGAAGILVRRVYVKLLRRDDSRNELSEQVAIDTSMLPRTSCAMAANTLLADMHARIRTFMTDFIVKTTTSWREGQPQEPFLPEAKAAHQAAVAAGEAFVAFLATREETAADSFLEQIGTLVDTVAAVDPPRYSALLEELAHLAETLDPKCRDELQPLYEANAHTLEPLAHLLEETGERVRVAAEGGSHA
jgi:hypothetical protein